MSRSISRIPCGPGQPSNRDLRRDLRYRRGRVRRLEQELKHEINEDKKKQLEVTIANAKVGL